jgi:hypothetical protein
VLRKLLTTIVKNPWLNLVIGLVVFSTGASDAIEELDELALGSHHGVMLVGLIHLFEAAERLLEGLAGGE